MRTREPRPTRDRQRFAVEIAAGARHLLDTPALRRLTLGGVLAMLVVGFMETVIFAVLDVLGRPPSFLGVTSLVQGLGSIVGGLTAAAMLRRAGDIRLAGLGLALFAGGDALFLVPTLPVVLLGFFVAGVGITWAIVAYMTALQQRSPLAIQGRVSAAADLALTVPQTISIALGAGLVSVLDFRVLVAAMTVVTLAAALYLVREVPSARALRGFHPAGIEARPAASPARGG
jgi:hypothetical protein